MVKYSAQPIHRAARKNNQLYLNVQIIPTNHNLITIREFISSVLIAIMNNMNERNSIYKCVCVCVYNCTTRYIYIRYIDTSVQSESTCSRRKNRINISTTVHRRKCGNAWRYFRWSISYIPCAQPPQPLGIFYLYTIYIWNSARHKHIECISCSATYDVHIFSILCIYVYTQNFSEFVIQILSWPPPRNRAKILAFY